MVKIGGEIFFREVLVTCFKITRDRTIKWLELFYPSKIYSKLYFLAYRPQYPVLNEPLNALYGDLNQSCLSGCAGLKNF